MSPTVHGCCAALSSGTSATVLGQEVLTIDEIAHGLLGFHIL